MDPAYTWGYPTNAGLFEMRLFPCFEVERDGPVNPHEGTGHRKRSENPFRRFAVLKCMNNAVERNAGASDIVAAITLLDVILQSFESGGAHRSKVL